MIDKDKLIRSIKACAHHPEHDCAKCEYSESLFCYNDELIADFETLMSRPRIGKWMKEDSDGYLTPGGTPYYVCEKCGGSGHLHGVEYSKRKVFCEECGTVNFYPWETLIEEGM